MKIKSIVLAALALITTSNLSYAEISEVKLPKIDDSIGQYAYLRDKLPEDTLAYIRVTHPVVHLFSAKNRTNDAALLQKSSINALKDFREVLSHDEKLTERLQLLGLRFNEENFAIINYLSSLLYSHLNGPIEGIISNKNREFSLTAQGLISIPVNIQSVEDLNRILAENPLGPSLLQFDQEGYATHEMASFYFSPKAQRIIVIIGLETYSLTQIKAKIAALKIQKNHEMYAFENQIDLTGQNNFLWVDLRNKTGMFTAAMEDQKSWEIIQEIDGVALGDGTNREKQGQLKLIVKANAEKVLGLDPQLKNDFNFKTIGTPKAAVILPIPSVTMIKKTIETFLSSAVPSYLTDETTDAEVKEKTEAVYQEFQAQWIKHIGFDFAEILDFIGPNMTFYYDDLGTHTVLSIHNKPAFYRWLAQKNQEGVINYRQERKIHHVSSQNPLLAFIKKEDLSGSEHAGIAVSYPFINEYISNVYGLRVLDLNWHIYWSDEGDYIRLSSLPQMIEEELKLGDEHFNKWLSRQQGIDNENVLLAATLDWKNADRRWYYNYLQFLQNSADILGTNFDVAKMPRADQLALADSSRLGFQVTASNQFLTLSLDYGSSYNSSFISAFFLPAITTPLIGMMGALAVPAFEGYDNTSEDIDMEIDMDIDMESPIEDIQMKKSIEE